MSRNEIIKELQVAYGMELETVQNYIAASVNLDGIHAEVIKRELAKDVPTELEHARKLAQRIKVLGGTVPGSLGLERNQKSLQPPEETTDFLSIVKGVVEAEEGAIRQYSKIIGLCEGDDYVTQDLIINILGEEEEHRREFAGFLKEYERSDRSERKVA
jgi:bacterioferritin